MKKNNQSIYQQVMDAVREFRNVRVDLVTKTVAIGKRVLVDNGKWEGDLGISGTDAEDALGAIATAYRQFKWSAPNERSRFYRCPFTAAPDSEMDTADLIVAVPRQVAGTHLCMMILCNVLNGSIRWEDFESDSHWFHRFPENDLRLLKSWF